MYPAIVSTILCFSLVLSIAPSPAAEGAAGHAHTEAAEAGHFPSGKLADSARYVDSEPPLWNNLGTLRYPITTANSRAQRYFDQGLRLTYAFNHLEAQRAFRMAQKLDPHCAMCFWGEAVVLGPNINAPMDAAAVGPAWAAITQAKKLAKRASVKERALIDAARQRYEKKPAADRKNLDDAYAAAMGRLTARYPDDEQIAVLYAESLMNLSPWDYWEDGGSRPKGRTAEILKVLEAVLAKHPEHPGAIHDYIHMVEASDRPERAEPYAARLPALMPGAGHLVHMPGHLYYRLGRYADALEANRAAIAVDEAYLKETGARGIYAQGYYPHNVHFLMASAQMAGDGRTSLAAAEKLPALISDDVVRKLAWTQPIKAAPYFAHAQFSAPETVFQLPDPGPEFPYVRALWRYARGVAAATHGAAREARSELEALAEIARSADFSALTAAGVPAPDVVRIAQAVLTARIAHAEGDYRSASSAFRTAAELQQQLPYMEPPYWYYPVRRSLGALLLWSGDRPGAARELEAALRESPNDAWSLWGLASVYREQGRRDAAAELEQRLSKSLAKDAAPAGMDRL